MLAHVARIVTLRNQKSRSSGDLLAYVHSRCGTKRTMAYAALACRCRTPSTRMLDQPFGPVRPPRSLMRLRPRQPVIGIVGQEIVGPIVALLLLRRVYDAGDMTRRAQHEPRIATDELNRSIRGTPRHDMILARGIHVARHSGTWQIGRLAAHG